MSSKVSAKGRLNISIGYNYGAPSLLTGAQPESGAYGIEFNITPEMYQNMNSVILSFDYDYVDVGLDNGEDVWVKARFGNLSQMNYLGSNLDASEVRSTAIGPPQTLIAAWSQPPSGCLTGSPRPLQTSHAQCRPAAAPGSPRKDLTLHSSAANSPLHPEPT